MTLLKYSLKEEAKAVTFQITYQSPLVKSFFTTLKNYGLDSYMAKNGIRVAISDFPEWKKSKNTVYLRGLDSSKDLKEDRTRFVSESEKRNMIAMFNDALNEFISSVKKAYENGLFDNYSYSLAGKNPLAFVNRIGKYSLSPVEEFICRPVKALPKYNTKYFIV